jgi:uncharacterized protein
VTQEERAAGVVSAPVIDLRFAAGNFSDAQALEDGAGEWVALPDWVRPLPDWVPPLPGLFIAQVVGKSMNRRIPNGAWCSFRANPSGTREGKVVMVQHRSIENAETGGGGTPSRSIRARSDWRKTRAGSISGSRFRLIPIGVSFCRLTSIWRTKTTA